MPQARHSPCAATTGYCSQGFSALKPWAVRTRRRNVLVHGGSGGVGSFAIQLGKFGGLSVAATGRTANREYLIEMGADLAIDYTDPVKGIVAQTREWAPDGVDVVFDAVRQITLPDALDALKPGGTCQHNNHTRRD